MSKHPLDDLATLLTVLGILAVIGFGTVVVGTVIGITYLCTHLTIGWS